MAELRILHSWSDKELRERLAELRKYPLNFPETGPESQAGDNWRRYYSESIIAQETAGKPLPGGAFEKIKTAISEYRFSDPAIVEGHFDQTEPLLNRTLALELKIYGLRYLCGVRVTDVREFSNDKETVFEFRYDTLKGHFEVGSEWFSLTKKHETGELWFRISASWRPGQFPNWWSRVGFEVVGRRYQLAWHRLAYLRLREFAGPQGQNLVAVPKGQALVHTGDEINKSDLWVLKAVTAGGRVQKASSADAPKPDSESSTEPIAQST